ncbi:hypothetical protein [Calycomorphotria hydatis]|uniref:Carboxypeptidase regulatory-like domain-containing protein n=1 Tax=Calycomorphotria hydatis TaxID=2528027 RepID=A0A517TDN6_9PLAN|nr:hypothetical protein [Calycomorphotria hydatis]QDT66488.1 hypothetical protein V22_37560 [Calycomorphotria hydatis]
MILKFQYLPLICGVALIAGCSAEVEGPDRFPVSGTVTYNGEPVKHGDILFSPDRDKGNSGPASVAGIKDGKYETFPGKGVIGGAFKVTISSENPEEAYSEPPFPPYETTIELPHEATTYDFIVPAK